MKVKQTRRTNDPVPTLSTPASDGVEGGRVEKRKTTIQALPGKKPNWRCGAPSGNRNAVKAVPSLSTIRRRVRALKRRVRDALAEAERLQGC